MKAAHDATCPANVQQKSRLSSKSLTQPWFPYDFPMISLWFPYDFHMISLWFPYDFPMISLWFPYDFPMICIWFQKDISSKKVKLSIFQTKLTQRSRNMYFSVNNLHLNNLNLNNIFVQTNILFLSHPRTHSQNAEVTPVCLSTRLSESNACEEKCIRSCIQVRENNLSSKCPTKI